MNDTRKFHWMMLPIAWASLLGGPPAAADVVTDWNVIAADSTVAGGLPPPHANRTLAMVQTAVYEAVNAITKRYPPDRVTPNKVPDASVAAAVAAANRAMLSRLVPSQQATIDRAYGSALAAIADAPAKTAGIAVGEQAAAAVLAWRGRRRGSIRTVPAGHDRRRIRPHNNPRRSAVGAAQAMGDDLMRPISTRAASCACK